MTPIITLLLACSLTLSHFASSAQIREQAFAMNERLGRGVNMGNSFEAPTETAWGNPWKPSYFKRIAELGFNHVRVPIRWETPERSMESAPYTIDPAFLDRIKEVIDSALRYKLHVIINMHHHDALFEDPEAHRDRFLSQWYQIADHFRDYPDSLLFEVLNEPHGALTPAMWNEYFADALTEIRKTNPTRFTLMGVAEYGGLGGLSEIVLPDDDHLILTIHYYNPFTFTHQGAEWVSGSDPWLGTEWLDTEADRESVASEFSYAFQFSESRDIPIHIGEFGVYSKADMGSRERWTTYLARWFEEQGMSWAYWEFSAGFGIYDPASQEYVAPLVDALLHNEMPEATPVFSSPVYTSDFSGGVDGWSLSLQGGAAGSLASSDNQLTVSIEAGGTEVWHLQLAKNNIRLEQDKLYRISFSAKASAERGITFYAGRASSPWNAYSSYNGVSITTQLNEYSFTFTMTDETDPAARLVFDLGTNTGAVNISRVKVEELTFAVTSVGRDVEQLPAVYPNPATSWIRVTGAHDYTSANLIDFSGRLLTSFAITAGTAVLDLSRIPSGMHILLMTGKGKITHVKLVKE